MRCSAAVRGESEWLKLNPFRPFGRYPATPTSLVLAADETFFFIINYVVFRPFFPLPAASLTPTTLPAVSAGKVLISTTLTHPLLVGYVQ